MAETLTLTQEDLDDLVQKVREEAIAALLTPASGPEPTAHPPVDLSDPDKVMRKYAKRLSQFWGGKPLGFAHRGYRRRIAKFGAVTGEAAERIFRGSLTKAQASAASYELERGRSIVIDGVVINPR
jgi:hypothetical protein